jgi:hypothetical protein
MWVKTWPRVHPVHARWAFNNTTVKSIVKGPHQPRHSTNTVTYACTHAPHVAAWQKIEMCAQTASIRTRQCWTGSSCAVIAAMTICCVPPRGPVFPGVAVKSPIATPAISRASYSAPIRPPRRAKGCQFERAQRATRAGRSTRATAEWGGPAGPPSGQQEKREKHDSREETHMHKQITTNNNRHTPAHEPVEGTNHVGTDRSRAEGFLVIDFVRWCCRSFVAGTLPPLQCWSEFLCWCDLLGVQLLCNYCVYR